MLLIPEIETVFIRVPRTGSSSLKKAIMERYPRTLEIYHHMEADGVPYGYDRWRRIGVVRDPVLRLYSLYRFLRDIRPKPQHIDGWTQRMRASVAGLTFTDWIVKNETVFTSPYSSSLYGLDHETAFHPFYAAHHPLPENRKSQFIYLRPDLGTRIYRYETDLMDLHGALDLATSWTPAPQALVDQDDAPILWGLDAGRHLSMVCGWEVHAFGYDIIKYMQAPLGRDP